MSTSMIGLAPVRRAISHNIAVTPSDFEDHFSRPYLNRVQDSLYEHQIGRAAASFEDSDRAEERSVEADRAVARAERRNDGFPLRRRQVERRQDQSPSTAAAWRDGSES